MSNFSLGSEGNKFYVILDGEVGIWNNNKTPINKYNSKEEEIENLRKGSTFGENSFKDSSLRKETIRANKNCHLAVLDRNDYAEILKEAKFNHAL